MYPSAAGSGTSGFFSLFSGGVFVAEEVWNRRRKVWRYHNGQCRDTLGCLLGELLGLRMFSTAKLSGFPEYQYLD
jgi:hypothetical protein